MKLQRTANQCIKIPVIMWRNYCEEYSYESNPHLIPGIQWIRVLRNPPALRANHAFKYHTNPPHTRTLAPGRRSWFQLISALWISFCFHFKFHQRSTCPPSTFSQTIYHWKANLPLPQGIQEIQNLIQKVWFVKFLPGILRIILANFYTVLLTPVPSTLNICTFIVINGTPTCGVTKEDYWVEIFIDNLMV